MATATRSGARKRTTATTASAETAKAAATRSGSRKRTTATAAKASTAKATATAALTCPECGRTFSRPAALGAHRARVHGVAGTSQNARSRRNAAARQAAATRPGRPAARTAASSATRTGSRANGAGVDHDALLRALFPDGIPPRQDLIAAVNDWLSQADRLARQR
jgi:DNA-binding protein HU-beta